MLMQATKRAAMTLLAVPLGIASMSGVTLPSSPIPVEMIDVAPRAYAYRMAGDFNQAGWPIDAPLIALTRNSALHIMKRQVTAAEYDRCVAEGKCSARAANESVEPELPAVRVSWRDATAYAVWLSARTGETWRLPTDEEWVFAAGSRFHDDGLLVAATRNPATRWLARYDRESQREALDQQPRPAGAFGVNELGLFDLSGNVWEWTNTCFTRQSLDEKGRPFGPSSTNCGVRVAEGEHRAYVIDFIRDARGGGCSVGKPPTNLGFRLVREDGAVSEIAFAWRRLMFND
ncbi:MAG TPA: SUMF1/EgtB/PvdO family nonheme iron enzyme [Methylocystis sp.]|nr:SUMF1/EgtB/PvdO family nonheme iron enzyme [Methylocystis sp.]